MLWADRIEIDLEYVRDQSLLLDLRILWRTVSAVLRGGGVEVVGDSDQPGIAVLERCGAVTITR